MATPSFADEVLKQILVTRCARSLTVRNAPDRFVVLLTRASHRLQLAGRVHVIDDET
jgi:hypothetical protein